MATSVSCLESHRQYRPCVSRPEYAAVVSKYLLLLSLLFVGCAKNAPPTLSPNSIIIWQSNEVAVSLGSLQSVAIGLNRVQQCAGTPTVCHPLLSDDNTRVVVDAVTDGLTSLRAVPEGWKATGLAVVDRITLRLDDAGQSKLSAYLATAAAILNQLVP